MLSSFILAITCCLLLFCNGVDLCKEEGKNGVERCNNWWSTANIHIADHDRLNCLTLIHKHCPSCLVVILKKTHGHRIHIKEQVKVKASYTCHGKHDTVDFTADKEQANKAGFTRMQ